MDKSGESRLHIWIDYRNDLSERNLCMIEREGGGGRRKKSREYLSVANEQCCQWFGSAHFGLKSKGLVWFSLIMLLEGMVRFSLVEGRC